MAYKWPGDGPAPGAAISSIVIGKYCPNILSASEVAELEAYLAKAKAELAQQDEEAKRKDSSYQPLQFDDFRRRYSEDIEKRFGDSK